MKNSQAGNKVKFVVFSIIVVAIIIISTIVFLLKLNEEKGTTRLKFDPILVKNIKRSTIYDRDRKPLCIDEVVNILALDKDKLDHIADSKKKQEIVKNILNVFQLTFSESDILKANSELIGLKKINSEEKIAVKEKISFYGLDEYVDLLEIYKRVKDEDLNPSLKRFIGNIDEISRSGQSGIEKLLNKYISSTSGLQANEKLGHDVDLTISLSLIEQIDDIVDKYSPGIDGETHIIVFGADNHELFGIWDNMPEDEKFDDEIYNFSHIRNSSISICRAPLVLSMIQTDPTLLDIYYCNGENCDGVHEDVNLYNMINCKAAIKSLAGNYERDDLDKTDRELQFGNIMSRFSLRDILRLMFMGFRTSNVPSFFNDDEFESAELDKLKVYPDNMILKIDGVDDSEFRNTEDILSYDAGLKGMSQDYLKRIFTNNICKEIYGFETKDGLLVLLYQKNGVDMKFANRLKNQLDRFTFESSMPSDYDYIDKNF